MKPNVNEHTDPLADRPFSYRETKDGKVLLYHGGKQVMTLKGAKAAAFRSRISGLDEMGKQMAMAKITGNFKRGNERQS